MSKSNPISETDDTETELRPLTNLAGRTLITVLVSLAYTVLILASLRPWVSAQEPPIFQIRVTPVSDHAVKGQPFTYTVAVTNVSAAPIANVAINVDIPNGTEFVNTRHSSLKWYGGTPFSDPNIKIEQITLFTLEDIEPDEVFVFDMIVEVLPEVDQPLVVEVNSVATLEGEILASGSVLNTPVRAPTSTPRPTLPPSPTTIMTPTPTPTSPSSTVSEVDDSSSPLSPSDTPPAPTGIPAGQSSVPDAATSPDTASGNVVPSTAILAVIGVILVLTVVAIGWFVKRK